MSGNRKGRSSKHVSTPAPLENKYEPVTENQSSTSEVSTSAENKDDPTKEFCSNTSQKFKIRPGTNDSGKPYEAKVAALLALRCANVNTKDMWIASNAHEGGDFDDVVLIRQTKKDHSIAYMLQLKHKENSKNLKSADFISDSTSNTKKNPDFQLSKYCASFRQLKNLIHSESEQSKIIEHLRNVNKIVFVLFTNRSVGECKFLKKHCDGDISFLNTSNASDDLYGFDYIQLPDYNPELIKSFFLLPNQTKVDGVDDLIEEEIKQLISPLIIIDKDLTSVSKSFVEFITRWAQNNLKEQFFLTKKDVISKLTDLLLNCYKVKLPDDLCSSIQSDLLHDFIREYNIIVDWDENLLQFLVQHFASRVEDICGRNEPTENKKKKEKKYWGSSFTLWGNNLREPLKESMCRRYEDFEEYMIKFEGNPKKITFLNVCKYLWLTHRLPILLEVKTVGEFENIANILGLSNFTLRVIIINKTSGKLLETHKICKRFETLKDLNKNHREKVLNRAIKLQGKPLVLLRSLVDNSMFQYLTSNDIIHTLLGNFNIGNIYSAPPDYMIERRIYRVLLKPSVLTSNDCDLFVINKLPDLNFNFPNLSKIINFANIDSADLNKINIIIIDGNINIPIEEKRIQELHESSKRTIHWLLCHNLFQLEWKKSFGNTNNIKLYQFDEQEEDDLKLTCPTDEIFSLQSSTNILSASPGMGKSTLMDYLAYQAPKDLWILNINLNRHEDYYDTEECSNPETSALMHLKYFNRTILEKCNCDSKLAQAIFLKMLGAKKVIVLLDGFDEICYNFKNEVTNIAKSFQREGYKMWITTRPVMKSYLEKELKSIATSLQPFSLTDQKEFLEKYFLTTEASENLSLGNRRLVKDFIEKLLKSAALNLNDRDREFMGVPLQTKLLGEYFKADYFKSLETNAIKLSGNFNLIDLYQQFITKKMNIFRERYGATQKKEFEKYREYQYLFALKTVFEKSLLDKLHVDETLQPFRKTLGVEYFQKDGIMIAENEFVHRTYAEYLSAKWLAENFNHESCETRYTVKVILNKRFDENYNFVFNIFDRIVCENCEIHLAIINGQLKKAFTTINSSNSALFLEDKLGRNLFHITASYGEFSPSQTLYEQLITVNNNRKTTINKIVELLSIHKNLCVKYDKLGYSPLDYAIASGSLKIANTICVHSINLDIHVRISGELKSKYFFHCGSLNYKHLFYVLLKYFARITILNEPNKNVTLESYCIEHSVSHQNVRVQQNLKNYVKILNTKNISDLFLQKIYTDLHVAAACFNCYMVNLLLNKNEKVNQQDAFLRTPLHYAVQFNKRDIIKLLIQKGADLNIRDLNTKTPMELATELKKEIKDLFPESVSTEISADNVATDKAVCNILVEEKLIDVLNEWAIQQISEVNYGHIIIDMYKAIKEGDFLTVKKHLSNGIDVNYQNGVGNTFLHLAVQHKKSDIVKYLMLNGANVGMQNYVGDTALHCSIKQNSSDITLLILSHTVSIKKKHMEANKQDLKKQQINLDMVSANTDADSLSPARHNSTRSSSTKIILQSIDNGVQTNKNRQLTSTSLYSTTLNLYFDEVKTSKKNAQVDMLKSDKDVVLHINKQNVTNSSPLHLAIHVGDLDAVKILLENRANINMYDHDKNTPLHIAILSGRIDIISMLLYKRAEINIQNADKYTPAHFAARKGDFLAMKLLLDNEVDITIPGYKGNTVLHTAARNGSQEIISVLLSAGSEINRQNAYHYTAISYAAYEGNLDAVKLLLDKGADITNPGYEGNTVLHSAAESGSKEIISLLLDAGSEVNNRNVHGDTPIKVAALKGHLDAVKLLLVRGADITTSGYEGNTVLHAAAESGSQEIISLLLDAGSEVNRQNADGDTPIQLAALQGHLDAVKMLLDKGADITITDKNRTTVLHVAAVSGVQEIILLLLNAGSEVNNRNADGVTPIQYAALQGYLDAVKLLLGKGADITTLGKNEMTVLHMAAVSGSQKIVSLLLNAGSEVNNRNAHGITPIQFAAFHGHLDVVKLFIDKGADITIPDKHGNTVLHMAAISSSQEIISLSLSAGLQVNIRNADGVTPIQYAALQGHLDAVKLFLCKGADIKIPHKTGTTVLHAAAESGSQEIISLLLNAGLQVNNRNALGDTPIKVAVLNGHLNVVQLLLDKGANITITGYEGNTLLHVAAVSGSPEIISVLLNARSEVNNQNAHGDTPIKLAALKGHLDAVKLLLDKDADIKIADKNGNTVLHMAAISGSQDMISLLLNAGSEVNNRNAHGHTPIIFAAIKGHLDAAKFLLDKKADINIPDKKGNTVLHMAAISGSQEMISLLLNAGSEVNHQNAHGDTPMKAAALKGHLDAVKLLLAKGANIQIPDENGNSVLHIAAISGSQELILLLLNAGSEMNNQNAQSDTSIKIAVLEGHLKAVKLFLDKGADIKIPDKNGNTVLHTAAVSSSLEIISLLLNAGSEVNNQNAHGDTPIKLAALKGHLDAVKLLLDKGADIKIADKNGNTVLHMAAISGSQDMISLLLNAGSEANNGNIHGDTPISFAAVKGHLGAVKLFLDKGADITNPGYEANTVLHMAARSGSQEIISLLLNAGSEVNHQNAHGDTPMKAAALKGHLDAVKLLLDKGADITIPDKKGNTVLHGAAESGSQEIISLFLNAGSEVNIQNIYGNTPIKVAALHNHLDAVKFFMGKGADIKIPDKNGNTVLHVAAESGSQEMISLLVNAGSEVNKRNIHGDTPIIFAAGKGHLDAVKLLLDKGADITVRGYEGNTALHVAAVSGSMEIISLLLNAGSEVNNRNLHGDTSIKFAVLQGHLDAVKLLLDKEADITIPGYEGNTALHVAAVSGSQEIISLLLNAGSEVNNQNAHGDTPIKLAALQGHLNTVNILLEQ